MCNDMVSSYLDGVQELGVFVCLPIYRVVSDYGVLFQSMSPTRMGSVMGIDTSWKCRSTSLRLCAGSVWRDPFLVFTLCNGLYDVRLKIVYGLRMLSKLLYELMPHAVFLLELCLAYRALRSI